MITVNTASLVLSILDCQDGSTRGICDIDEVRYYSLPSTTSVDQTIYLPSNQEELHPISKIHDPALEIKQ